MIFRQVKPFLDPCLRGLRIGIDIACFRLNTACHTQHACESVPDVVGLLSALEIRLFGCFYKLEILFVGLPGTRTLVFGVHSRAPDFWKVPFRALHPGALHLHGVTWEPKPVS